MVQTQVRGGSIKGWSALWKSEDWLATWAGLLILAIFLAGLSVQLPDWKWLSAGELAGKAPQWNASAGALQAEAGLSAEENVRQALGGLRAALGGGARGEVRAAAGELEKAAGSIAAKDLKARVAGLAAEVRSAAGQTVARVLSWANLRGLIVVFAILLIFGLLCTSFAGKDAARFAAGFPLLFILGLAGFFVAGNGTVSFYGIEFVFWSLALGLLISNIVGVPPWLRAAVNTELYIKMGLVLLGAEMLFSNLLKAGALGMIQAVVVITAVWYFCFWLAGRLGLDEEFAAILATGVSVCGVSAAIAAGGALKGDPRKVSHTISLVLLIAVPMLILQPLIARLIHLPAAVTGAWIGGTIDTTGAVAAAGQIAGKQAMTLAMVVKMSQNALIGLVAFLLAIWSAVHRKNGAERPNPMDIWDRFPKFVLGFIFASLVFSLLVPEASAKATTKVTAGLRGFLFSLAFLSIGLETRIRDLVAMKGGRPALSFIGAQAFNILWTLLIAALLFGGVLFAVPRL